MNDVVITIIFSIVPLAILVLVALIIMTIPFALSELKLMKKYNVSLKEASKMLNKIINQNSF